METQHVLFKEEAASALTALRPESIDLVVTSPPYPMIKMWDEMLGGDFDNDPKGVYNHQHMCLRHVFDECVRLLRPGGFMCVNIGDAVRTIKNQFALYPNHSKLIEYFLYKGLTHLPGIIWRKPTNAPNKFMGSGMLPCMAYVTLEHEHILVFRKGAGRKFTRDDTYRRRQSAYFWEERNKWFSDLWEIRGIRQNINGVRTAAFPFDIPHRLINMFSIQGDTVLDPFLGAGTTTAAAIINARNSVGCEIRKECWNLIDDRLDNIDVEANTFNYERLRNHHTFTQQHPERAKCECKNYQGLKCTSNQETDIQLWWVQWAGRKFEEYFGATYHQLNFEVPPSISAISDKSRII